MRRFLAIFISMIGIGSLALHAQPLTSPDACMVVEESSDSIWVESPQLARHVIHRRWRVLPGSEELGQIELPYDGFQRLVQVACTLRRPGEKPVVLGRKDMRSLSNFADFSLFEDNQMLVYYPTLQAPYEVEYTCVYELSCLLNLPRWIPQGRSCTQVRHASLHVGWKPGMNVRSLVPEEIKHLVQITSKPQSIHCEVRDLMPLRLEEDGISPLRCVPTVCLAADKFEAEGYMGSTTSWGALGSWELSLLRDANGMDEGMLAFAHALRDSLPPLERVNAVFHRLQQTKRYVSIQVGLGGWKPFSPREVEAKGYGDCKALSHYVVSLLGEAGVRAHCVLVKAGRDAQGFHSEFPSNQFNHMIACVPMSPDTIWLECTSMKSPVGHLGEFTAGRPALLLTDEGGVLVRTPALNAANSLRHSTLAVSVEATGAIHAEETIRATGAYLDELEAFTSDPRVTPQSAVLKTYDLSGMEVGAVRFMQEPGIPPAMRQSLSFSVKRFATPAGKRLLMAPNIYHRFEVPPSLAGRKTTWARAWSESWVDSICIRLPEGTQPEYLPPSISLRHAAGEYDLSVTLDQGKLIWCRRLFLYPGEWAPEQQQDLLTFLGKIASLDQEKAVFLLPGQ